MSVNDYVDPWNLPGGIGEWTVNSSLLADLKRAKGVNFPIPDVLPLGAVEVNAQIEPVFRNKGGRPQKRRPGSRPWQGANYATRAAWEADGSPGPPGK